MKSQIQPPEGFKVVLKRHLVSKACLVKLKLTSDKSHNSNALMNSYVTRDVNIAKNSKIFCPSKEVKQVFISQKF